MIKAIISDFDGTLVDTFEANYHAYKKAFKEAVNIDLNRDFYFNNFGLRIDDICKLLNIDDLSLLKHIKELKANYYPNFFEYLKINESLFNTYKALKAQGIKIALATTAAHKNLYNVLNYLNIADFFDLIVCGDDVNHGKPDPEVYIVAMNKLNVKPNETLIFEDSVAGIDAANNAKGNVIKIKI
jgi:HAD superfamily hydrolase (TIGR01509 family)